MIQHHKKFCMKNLIFIPIILLSNFAAFAQSISINNDGSAPNASAMLDVKSTTKGMLVPRMTTAQRTAIATPAKGLLVFDTDNSSFWFYNGVAWNDLSAGGSSNNWTASGTNIYNSNTGNVGIGISTPLAPLHIKNDNEAVRIQGATPYISFNDNQGLLKGFLQSYNNDLYLGTPAANTTGTLQFYTSNTPVMTIAPTGNVGIGTTSPASLLTLQTGYNTGGFRHVGVPDIGTDSIIVSEGIGGVSAAIGTLSNHAFRINAGGTGRLQVYPTGDVVVGDNNVGSFGKFTVKTLNNSNGISHLGEGGNILATRMGGSSAGIGTFSPTHMRIFCSGRSDIFIASATGNVGIGYENYGTYKLAVNGTIRSKEIIVETANWADYVFDNDYKLTPLDKVEEYISRNKHLPNIPSAKEIEEKGLQLGDNQKKMMEKIEELTLYIIEANKKIEKLEQINREKNNQH